MQIKSYQFQNLQTRMVDGCQILDANKVLPYPNPIYSIHSLNIAKLEGIKVNKVLPFKSEMKEDFRNLAF